MEEGDAVEVLYKNELDSTGNTGVWGVCLILNEASCVVKLLYCPYRDCTAGCFRNPCNLYKHIREGHDPTFILNSANGKLVIYVGSSHNKKIIDLSGMGRLSLCTNNADVF